MRAGSDSNASLESIKAHRQRIWAKVVKSVKCVEQMEEHNKFFEQMSCLFTALFLGFEKCGSENQLSSPSKFTPKSLLSMVNSESARQHHSLFKNYVALK